jgi:hypothetical protein
MKNVSDALLVKEPEFQFVLIIFSLLILSKNDTGIRPREYRIMKENAVLTIGSLVNKISSNK